MNPIRSTYILLTALSALLLPSCAQDEPDVAGGTSDSDEIIFHTSMPGVITRSYDNIQMGDLQGGFSVTAHNLDVPANSDGSIPLYFKEVEVKKTEGMGDAYRSDLCKWPENKGTNNGNLRIYAFYPSLDTLKKKSGIFEPGTPDLVAGKEYFLIHDISNINTGVFSYRIGNLKVNRDISRHVDVVTAFATGNKTENLYSGVTLNFSHRLSRIEFKAWSANPSYAVEIAGIRIGGAIVSSTLNMDGGWLYGSATEKNIVEYIFRKGDTVVTLDGKKYNSPANAKSIMGNGGWAMIIPGNQGNNVGKYTEWNKTADKNGVYFSVLMRVIDNTDDQGLILYPYTTGATITGSITAKNKNLIYLAVEKATGKVIDQVSATYESTDEKVEVRAYNWAAMPFSPVWDAGKKYTYTLNYTNGIGVHAPDDDAPGKAIITALSIVGIEEDKDVWVTPYKEEVIELENGDDGYQQE